MDQESFDVNTSLRYRVHTLATPILWLETVFCMASLTGQQNLDLYRDWKGYPHKERATNFIYFNRNLPFIEESKCLRSASD